MNHLSLFWRGRTVLASIIGTLVFTSSPLAFAAMTSFSDISSGVWYEQSVANLVRSGALHSSQTRFRPNDLATRSEVFNMLVSMNDVTLADPSKPSFSDVPRSSTSFQSIETAAREGWLEGDKSCYGKGLVTCTASPFDRINRAEMAILLQRSFKLHTLNTAPRASDISSSDWFTDAVQAAADHCILQGDDVTGLVRPASLMNRSEMIVMFDRASMNQTYGVHCGERPEAPGTMSSISSVSADTIQVTFNINLHPNYESDLSHYAIEGMSNGESIGIASVKVIDSRMVEIKLRKDLQDGVQYRFTAKNMQSQRGVSFDTTRTFTSDKGTIGALESVTALSPTVLLLTFNGDLDANSTAQIVHYRVSDVSGNYTIVSTKLVNNNSVQLILSTSLRNQQEYAIAVNGLTGKNGGMLFNDSKSIIYNPSDISLMSRMNGQKEIPYVSTYTTGTGVFLLTSIGLQYDITVKRIDDTTVVTAHFNRGLTGVEGPILQTITFNGLLHAVGTWTNLTIQDRDDILNGRIYIEVDGSSASNGKIRGQIERQ
jgi:hypothetical protein